MDHCDHKLFGILLLLQYHVAVYIVSLYNLETLTYKINNYLKSKKFVNKLSYISIVSVYMDGVGLVSLCNIYRGAGLCSSSTHFC